MATLSAWNFNTPQGADEALAKPEKLSRDFLINLHDAAVLVLLMPPPGPGRRARDRLPGLTEPGMRSVTPSG